MQKVHLRSFGDPAHRFSWHRSCAAQALHCTAATAGGAREQGCAVSDKISLLGSTWSEGAQQRLIAEGKRNNNPEQFLDQIA